MITMVTWALDARDGVADVALGLTLAPDTELDILGDLTDVRVAHD